MAGQVFVVGFRVETDCEETVSEADVLEWAESHFEGCDMGEVGPFKVVERQASASAFGGWVLSVLRRGTTLGGGR